MTTDSTKVVFLVIAVLLGPAGGAFSVAGGAGGDTIQQRATSATDLPEATGTSTSSSATLSMSMAGGPDIPDNSELLQNESGGTNELTRGRSTKINVEFDIDGLTDDGAGDTIYIEFPTSMTIVGTDGGTFRDSDGGAGVGITGDQIVDRNGGTDNALKVDVSNDGDGTANHLLSYNVFGGSLEVTPNRADGSPYPVTVDIENSAGSDLTDEHIGDLKVTDNTNPQDPSSVSFQDGTDGINAAEASGGVDVDVGFSSPPEPGTVTVRLTDENGDTLTGTAPADTDSTTTTVTVTGLTDGTGTDLVDGAIDAEAKITDTASNTNSAGYTARKTVTLDTEAPSLSAVSLANDGGNLDFSFDSDEQLGSDPGDLQVSVEAPDAGANWQTFDSDDFTVSGGGPYTYELDTTQAYSDGDGNYTVSIDTAQDTAGNDGSSGEQASHVYDTQTPTITSAAVASDNSYVDVTFNEGVSSNPSSTTGLTDGDLSLSFVQNGGAMTDATIDAVTQPDAQTSGSASALTGGEQTVRVFLDRTNAPATGVETVEITPTDGSSIYDLAGSAMGSGETTGAKTLTDRRKPTIDSAVKKDLTTIDVTLSDGGTGLDISEIDASDFTVSSGSVSGVNTGAISDGDTAGTVSVTLASEVDADAVTVSLQSGAGGIADLAGNARTSGSASVGSGMDGVAPTLDDVTKGGNKKAIEVTISDGVDVDETTVSAADFDLSDGSISSVDTSETGGTTTVNITLTSAVDAQTVDVDVVGSIADTSGNTLTSGSGTATGMDGVAPPTPTITSTTELAGGDIDIIFGDVDDASSVTYEVRRATSSGGPYGTVVESSITDDDSASYTVTDTSTSGDTTYYYVVRADDGKNAPSQSTEAQATADPNPPAISVDTVTEKGGDDIVSESETVRVEATVDDTDANSDVATVTLDASKLGKSSTLSPATQTGSSYSWEFDVGTPTVADGSVQLSVDATDDAGNSNSNTGDSVTLDTTGPAFTASSVDITEEGGDDIVKNGDEVNVTVTIGSEASSVASVTVDASALKSGATALALSGSGTGPYTTTFTIDSNPSASDGSVYLPVTATDNQGNANTITEASTPSTDPVTLDTTVPTAPGGVSATALPDGEFSITFDDVNETGSGVTSYRIKRDTSSGGSFTNQVGTVSDDDSGSYTFTDTTSTTDGTTYYYVVTAVDKSGKASAHSAEASATADDDDPGVASVGLSESALSNGQLTQTVTLTFDEAMDQSVKPTVSFTGLDSSYQDNDGTWQDSTTYQTTISITDDAEDATATIEVTGGTDEVGNVMPTETPRTFPVDTRAPTVTTSYGGSVASGTVDLPSQFTITEDDGGTTTYEYSTDGGSTWTTITSPGSWDTTGVSDGSVDLRVTDTDDVGNSDSTTATITVDNNPPSQVTGVSATATAGGDVTIEFDDVDEDGSGVTTYRIERATAGGSFSTLTTITDDDSPTYSYTDSPSSPGDGTQYDYRIVAIDAETFESSPSAVASATADSEDPGAASVGLSESALSNGRLTQTVTLTFDEAMDQSVKPTVSFTGLDSSYQDSDGTWQDSTTYQTTISITDDAEDATATIEVTGGTDEVGNVMPTETPRTFPVDTRAPTVTTSYGGSVASGTVDLTSVVTITENDGGTTTYEYSTDGSSTWTTIASPGSWDTTGVSDGSVDLRVTDTDDVGNSDSTTATITVDNNPPSQVTGVSATATAGGDVTIEFNDVDEVGSGVTTYRIERATAGGSFSTLTTLTDDDSPTYSYTDSPSSPGDGTQYDYRIVAIDAENFESSPSAVASATADAVEPTFPTFDVSESGSGTLEVTIDASEPLSSISVDLSGPESATLTSFGESGTTYTTTYDASTTGTYTVTLTEARDGVGNDGASSQTDTVSVDVTGPTFNSVTVEELGGDDTVVPGDTVNVSAELSDPDSGIDDSTVTVDASPLGGSGSLSLSKSAGVYTNTFTVTSPTASEGAVTLTVSATDNDGNSNAGSDAVTLDTTAPTFSAVTVTEQGGDDTVSTGETVLVEATVSDSTSGVSSVTVDGSSLGGPSSLVLDHESGDPANVYDATFSVSNPTASDGTVTLTAEADDGQGFTETAGDAITLDTTPPSVTDVLVTEQNGDDLVTTGDVVYVSANVTDATSTVGAVTVDASSLGGSSSVSLSKDGTEYNGTVTVGKATEGVQTLTVEARDSQQQTGTGSDSITVDTTPPADPASVTFAADPVDDDASIDVTFPSPPEQGTVTIEVTDGSTTVFKSVAANTSGTTTTVSVDISSLAVGTVTGSARIVDVAGNQNPSGATASTSVQKEQTEETEEDTDDDSTNDSGNDGGGSGGGLGGGQELVIVRVPQETATENNTSTTDRGRLAGGNVTVESTGNTSTITVRNTDPQQPTVASVNTADRQRTVSVESLEVATPESNYTLELQVTADFDTATRSSESRDGTAPSLSEVPGWPPMGFVRLEHSIPDERIDYVIFRFSVDRGVLEELGIDPADVSLYRWHDRQWQQLPTTHLRTINDTYQFRADAPGMSVFAVSRASTDVLGTTETGPDENASRAAETTTTSSTGQPVGTPLTHLSVAVLLVTLTALVAGGALLELRRRR
jgi:hypothetical protein